MIEEDFSNDEMKQSRAASEDEKPSTKSPKLDLGEMTVAAIFTTELVR